MSTRRRVAEGRNYVKRNILEESYSNTRVRRGAVVQEDETDAQEYRQSKPEGPALCPLQRTKDGPPSKER